MPGGTAEKRLTLCPAGTDGIRCQKSFLRVTAGRAYGRGGDRGRQKSLCLLDTGGGNPDAPFTPVAAGWVHGFDSDGFDLPCGGGRILRVVMEVGPGGGERTGGAMNPIYVVGLGVAAGLLVYLFVALLKPENFG